MNTAQSAVNDVQHKPIARHVKVPGRWWRLIHFLVSLREGQYHISLTIGAEGIDYTLWTPQETRTTY